MSTIVDQDFPYDIYRRGSRDASRHNKRVKDATKKQLKDIVSQQDIITSEGNKKIKVRLKYLDQFRFIHSRENIDNVGRDEFNDLEEGETIYKPQKGGSGRPNKAGDQDGGEIFEAEFSIEQITDMMMEDLDLPDLDETKKNEIVNEVLEWTDRRKATGVHACLDKKKTLLANLIRKAKQNQTSVPIIKDDLRFRTWSVAQEKHSNAVIFLMMDRSGSMIEDKIYAVKALYFWIVQFLKRKYDRVEIKFIAHDVAAKELQEKEFFTISDSGGTMISSAYEMCRDMIKYNYPSSSWNVYCFHASDGDSWGDEGHCVDLVEEIISLGASLFAYSEIKMGEIEDSDSHILLLLRKAMKKHKNIVVSTITEMNEILATLQIFLRSSTRKAF